MKLLNKLCKNSKIIWQPPADERVVFGGWEQPKLQVVLLTGLGSSLPLVGRIWRKWAFQLGDKIHANPRLKLRTQVSIITSDGTGSDAACELLVSKRDSLPKIRRKSATLPVVLIGHSNGVPEAAEIMHKLRRRIDYKLVVSIDWPLGFNHAKIPRRADSVLAYKGPMHWPEFTSSMQHATRTGLVPYHKVYVPSVGHTELASTPVVQRGCFNAIKDIVTETEI